MSFGFEVRAADGSIQLDTTTWGWQFVYTFAVTETRRNLRYNSDLGCHVGETQRGSIVFDGQGGRPYVPAGSELYAMNVLNQTDHPHMIWNEFSYGVSGAYRSLSWGFMRMKYPEEDNGKLDFDVTHSTTVYVFAR